MKKTCTKILVLLGISIAVILSLNLLTPLVYRSLPNDYLRTQLILDSLDKGITTPSIVVLGNSRGMSGVNGSQLEDRLGVKVYNFCSPSQSLMESALYYEKLPDGVKTVIQCIDEREFDLKSMTLTTPAKLAFSMAGYKAGEFCSSLLTAEDLKEINQNPIIRNFKARTALKTGLSHIVVKALDEDAPGEGIYRVDYPYMYPSDSAMTYERDLALLKQFIPSPGHVFTVPEELKTFIHIGVEYLSSRDIEVVYVLMPLSPALGWAQETKIRKSQSVNETVEPNGFIDCLDILSSTDFYDPVHPNTRGAEVITAMITSYLENKE